MAHLSRTHRHQDLRLVLLGKVGAGKSASGNTLLGTPSFSSRLSASLVTQGCEAQTVTLGGRRIMVVDTPGLTARMVAGTAKDTLLHCLQLSAPGPHAFLLVIRLGRFTQEERDAVGRVVEVFGTRLYMFTIILFTFKDRLKGSSIEEYIISAGESLQQLVKKCGNRYHVFNNSHPGEEDQVEQLLVKLENLVAANGGRWYTDTDLVARPKLHHLVDSSYGIGHSLGATAQDVNSKMSEYGFKDEDLEIKILDLLSRLNLSQFYPQKLTTGGALTMSRTAFQTMHLQTEKDMVSVFLYKLFTMDSKSRYVTCSKEICMETWSEDFDDFLNDENDECVDSEDGNSQIHPMDVQMAVYHCADSFLRQNMVTKLFSCQYALPLLVPSPTSTDIELPLWTFRQIKKTWKSVGDSSTSLPVCQVKAPMVFFCRLGSVSTSKSQLLNSLIYPKHDTFFHRDSPGSSRTRLFMEGLVEIAWYCPAGNTDDLFSECTAFCNLHGDAAEHRKQNDFLTEQAKVNVVLMQNLKLNDKHRDLLHKLYQSSKPLICVVNDLKQGLLRIGSGNNTKIGFKDRDRAEVHKELITVIKVCLQKSHALPTFSLEDSGKKGKHCGFKVDEYSEDLLSRLNLSNFYPHKLTAADVLSIKRQSWTSLQSEEPQSEKDLAFVYISKLLRLDYRARHVTLHQCVRSQMEEIYEDVYHFLNEDDECIYEDNNKTTQIHPMDVQMAVFHCADSFLRQNMVTKLSSCQYALPLLVPSLTSTDIELPLWTFRQINKTWKSVGGSSTTLPVCQVKAPMVFFCRLGSVSTSKSQLLNSLINPKHDAFFHRDSPGSSRNPLFMEGLVEIAWYCPAGNTDDLFSECTAFCNLHGDAADHREQTDILMERATVIVVLIQNIDLKEKARELLKNLYKDSSKYLICVISDLQKGPVRTGSGKKIRIGLRDRNQAEIQEELRAAIRTCLQECNSAPTFCLEESSELAKRCGFRVDEDCEDCQEGKTGALEVMELLKGEDISQIKTKLLPCQGKLWEEWSSKNKQLYHLYGDVEQTKSKIQQEMKLIRTRQRETSLDLIKAVYKNLNSKHNTKKAYFVRWLGFYLDVSFLEELSEVTQQYYKQLLDVHSFKQRREITDDFWKKLKTFSEKVDAVTCGLEHIMREMGQIYEAWTECPGAMPAEVSALPAVAADLLISGHPLELMDGDAAHVPLTWIESVLDKATETLGDQRVFVLSVLGLQSSGKSTMLNTMFGLQFAVSAGRCTRGAFMQLIRVKEEVKEELRFDYLLVVDTEGLQSLQLVGKQSGLTHDNELATFVTGLADLTLINIFGENPAEMKDIIQIVVQAFLRMKRVKLTPSCMFVHQNVTDISAGEKNMEGRRQLQDKLDEMTRLAAAEEVCSAEYFTDVIKFNIQTDVHYFAQLWEGNPPIAPPNPHYSENVQNLKQAVLRAAAGKKCIRLSELKVRITDLWTAVLSEDFVFSFKNTLEISAYRGLEVMYGNWTWELRKEMLSIQNKLQNRIENGKLNAVDQKLIHEEINPTFTAVQSKMEKLFNEDKDAEILSQWKARTDQRIKDMCDSLTEVTYRKMTELIKLKTLCKKLDEKKTQYENELFNRSKDLASRLKDKAMNEQILRREFDSMWEKWLSDLRSEVPPVKDLNIAQEVMNILSSTFETRIVYSNRDSKQYKLIKNRREYSEYVIMKKQWVMISCKLDTKDHDSIRELVQQMVREAEEIIKTKPVDRTGYSDAYTQEIVNRVKKRVEEFKSERFRLKNEFTVDLSLFVCDIAVRKFTELHRVFREANDPVIYLDNKKGEFFSIFKKQCEGTTATTVFTDFICNKLKPSILQSVYDQTAIDAAGEMRANYPAFNGNRRNLEKHILQDLAEDENFERFITYIKNPKKHFLDFIHTKFKQEMREGRNPRILEILKNAVKMKQSSLFIAIQKATQETKQNRGGVHEWLVMFTLALEGEMKFTMKDLVGAQYQEITDTDFLAEEMNKTLQSLFDDITSSFNHISSVRMDMFRQRPEDILMKQLCGCWVQCPRCAAICTNTIEEHDGDHSVPFHRPGGVNGVMWCTTENLVVDICTSSVASDAHIRVPDGRSVPYKKYREAGPEYACWSITPDISEQAYWKWFVCRFQKDLEKHYNKTFQGRGKIPTAWKYIVKKEAVESLNA